MNGRPVIMTRLHKPEDGQDLVRALPAGVRSVIFLDTPPTVGLLVAVREIHQLKIRLSIRDHHLPGKNGGDSGNQSRKFIDQIRSLIGSRAVFVTRDKHPSCSTLVTSGEFSRRRKLIVADQDCDGLLSAMKATGLDYPGLDQDAAVLDGPHPARTSLTLSPSAWILVQALTRISSRESVKQEAFTLFVAHHSGDKTAWEKLVEMGTDYQELKANAHSSFQNLESVAPGLWYLNTHNRPRFDRATLQRLIGERTDCIFLVYKELVRLKATGELIPRFSITVINSHTGRANLQEIFARNNVGTRAGVVCNAPFVAYVDIESWEPVVLPILLDWLGWLQWQQSSLVSAR